MKKALLTIQVYPEQLQGFLFQIVPTLRLNYGRNLFYRKFLLCYPSNLETLSVLNRGYTTTKKADLHLSGEIV